MINCMEPWKKVTEPTKNTPNKPTNDSSGRIDEIKELFNMLGILNSIKDMDSINDSISANENINELSTKPNSTNININPEEKTRDIDSLAMAFNETVTDNKNADVDLKKLEKDSNFINKIYNLMKMKRSNDSENEQSKIDEINTKEKTKIPDSIIRTLITKFLNQRFISKESDLNSRSDSLIRSDGFYNWDNKNIAIHLKTKQFHQILRDKYGYNYESGESSLIPLSFYFDLSGSMYNYTYILSIMAIELLKKNVKLLVGYNQKVICQINKINGNLSIEEFSEILKNILNYCKDNKKKKTKIDFKMIDTNIDKYLSDKGAEMCVVFSDFDALNEIINLSKFCKVYYFCFESDFELYSLNKYEGVFYHISKIDDIIDGLVKINDTNFEVLKYEKNKEKVKRL